MADLSIEELQNVSHELSRSTPGSRRIAASPGFGGAAGDENISPVQKPAEKAAEGRGKPLAAASHKPNVTQPREARSQARINELEETVDELEGKLRAESSAKHELSIQIRKLKASLVEQEQKRMVAEEASSDVRREVELQQESWERSRRELNARINLLAEEKQELGEEIEGLRESKRRMCDDYETKLASIRKENTVLSKRQNGQEDAADAAAVTELSDLVQDLQRQLDEAKKRSIKLERRLSDSEAKLSMETERRIKAETALEEGASKPTPAGASADASAGAAAQIQELTDMLAERDHQIASFRKRIAAVEPWQGKGAQAREQVVEEIAQDVPKMKKALKAAVDDNKLLNEELDRQAEDMAKMEKRLARGEYNTFCTKLLAPKLIPPCSKCVGLQAQLTAAIKERDAATGMLENAKGNILDCDESLEQGLKLAEMNKQLAEKDKYISRLSEQAKAQIVEYKEVAKALFGYSLSKAKGTGDKGHGQYQVKSLFAVHSSDVILVQAQDGGKQVDMLGSDYSMRLKDHADRFFQEAHKFPPLPALLASITIEHYARCVG